MSQAPVRPQISAQQIDQLSINTIRTLSIDAVQQANSGHPGAPMGLAPAVYELWQRYLNYDPANPVWPNRDRFVLSAGHASMLLYSTLHLAGVRALNEKGEVVNTPAISLEEIKSSESTPARAGLSVSGGVIADGHVEPSGFRGRAGERDDWLGCLALQLLDEEPADWPDAPVTAMVSSCSSVESEGPI